MVVNPSFPFLTDSQGRQFQILRIGDGGNEDVRYDEVESYRQFRLANPNGGDPVSQGPDNPPVAEEYDFEMPTPSPTTSEPMSPETSSSLMDGPSSVASSEEEPEPARQASSTTSEPEPAQQAAEAAPAAQEPAQTDEKASDDSSK